MAETCECKLSGLGSRLVRAQLKSPQTPELKSGSGAGIRASGGGEEGPWPGTYSF